MNRRSFLRMLAAVPVLRHMPLPRSIYGDGDGTLTIPGNEMLSPHKWKKFDEISWGGSGGGGGGAGHMIVICTKGDITVSANGGGDSSKRIGDA